jgi:glycosyltransferase involved in cell wall biosynthesis
MRILHVTEQINPIGGCERLLRDTCRLLQNGGHDSFIAVAADTSTEDAPAPMFRLSRSWGPRSTRRVLAELELLLARIRPDIVHLHNIREFVSPFLLPGLRRHCTTIRYVHDARLFCPRHPSKRLARSGALCTYPMGVRCLMHCFPIADGPHYRLSLIGLCLRHAELAATRRLDAVLVGSEYMREQLLINGFGADKLHVLRGFTGLAPQPAPPASDPHVLAIGRFDGSKGLEDLPDVLAHLRTPGWSATLVGDGVEIAPARTRADALGLAERIDFRGQVAPDKLDALYRQAAVVVVPSRSVEAFGLVGVEAMAFARAVVAYDLGGVREWLQHERTGYLVPPGDATALAARLDALLGDLPLAQRMGEVGREQLEARFRPQHYLHRLLEIYGAVVSGRMRPQEVAGRGARAVSRNTDD